MSKDELSCILVIFGGTGDLTHRKLMPALYMLHCEKLIPTNFAVVSVGRRDKSTAEYRMEVVESVRKFSRTPISADECQKLGEQIYYFKSDFNDSEGYTRLAGFLEELDERYGTKGNRIYYFSVAPEYFAQIADMLQAHHLVERKNSWQRVVIEKPFGEDLQSAKFLNKKITEIFTEKNTYRIDHYLGKEMLQNIMVIRFANAIFEPIWNARYIDNIQISATETVGVEGRAGYYEKSGVLRDMLQNHMMQLLMLIAMEPPSSLETESIRDEKVKVLRSIKEFTPDYVRDNVIRGQYGAGLHNGKEVPGYRQETGVSPSSNVETYLALKVLVDNFRWAGMPFFLRTGKRMPAKFTDVVVQFKDMTNILYFKEYGNLEPGLLVIRIYPEEGIYLRLNAKKPGTTNIVVPVKMDFSQHHLVNTNSPEAYERLLYDVMRGDSTLFTRWDEVEHSWKQVDNIAEVWKEEKAHFPNYPAGSWGPDKAQMLLTRGDRKWWNVGGAGFGLDI